MKMTKKDFTALSVIIKDTITDNPDMAKQYKKLNLSDKRYRWDLLYLSGVEITKYYDYLNDDHIDTALRKIVRS